MIGLPIMLYPLPFLPAEGMTETVPVPSAILPEP